MSEQHIYNSLGVLRSLIMRVEDPYLRDQLERLVDHNITEVSAYTEISREDAKHGESLRNYKVAALSNSIGASVLPLCERITEEFIGGERVTLRGFFLNPTTPEVRRDWSKQLGELK